MLVFDGIVFSLQKHGGISVYFSEIASRFALAGHPSQLLMYGDNELTRANTALPSRQNRLPRMGERYRNTAVDGAGVFHSSYYRCAKGRGYLNVATVYDFTYERFMTGPRRWIHSFQKYRAIRNSDAVLCISESTKADLHRYLPDVPESKVFVTPLAANACFRGVQDHKCPGDYVVFVGARQGYKNFALLVRALAGLKDLRLVVVGGGAFSADEVAMMGRLIAGRYIQPDNVSQERLKELYSGAICLVYPSAYEGFGIPVLEAMMAGCPVIAMRSSSIPEVAGDAAILLDSPDEGLLSEAIQRVSQAGVRKEMLAKGFDRSALFSWDATFDKTRAVYEKLLGHAIPKIGL